MFFFHIIYLLFSLAYKVRKGLVKTHLTLHLNQKSWNHFQQEFKFNSASELTDLIIVLLLF